MEERILGKTGQSFPILSFGAQRIVDEEGCNESQAVEILNTAIDRGIRYFDTAWMYSAGQSEQRVGLVAKHRRKEMWIATKVWATGREEARQQLSDSLERLQTGYVDEWRLHNLFSFERLDAMMDGALQVAIEAKEEGLVRNISISGHTDPQVLVEALRRYPFDTALVAVSALDHFLFSFAEEFLPVAASKGVGVIGMKIFAYKKLAATADRALRYALSLPLSTVIVGCSTLAELEADLAVAENFTPMNGPERLAYFEEIYPLVKPENMPWKAVEWGNPVEWIKRKEPSGPAMWS
ncbi:MAG: aldo/keto reductase [Spirochaetaceae bacterium]|nr:MAG: aldo/keto reductase [Spirochaetaceae bacterium]